MNTYKIFRDTAGNVHAIKKGWSWPAFFFGAAWALFHGMWLLGLGIFGAALFIVLAAEQIGSAADVLINILMFAVPVSFGMAGNDLRAKHMARKGYEAGRAVQAADEEAALTSARAQLETGTKTF